MSQHKGMVGIALTLEYLHIVHLIVRHVIIRNNFQLSTLLAFINTVDTGTCFG